MSWRSSSCWGPVAERKADKSGRKPVVLVGFMAAGKSKIGRLLAERLGVPFVDTDKAIEDSFGIPIAEIFRDHGESVFRDAERRLIAALLAGDAKVVASGGGAFIDSSTRELLNRDACTVWLDTPIDHILARLARSDSRPLVMDRSEQELRDLWDQRRGFYSLAHIRIDTSDRDPHRTVDRIAAALA